MYLEINIENHPALFKYADDSTLIVPIWSNGHVLSHRFGGSVFNSEIIFHKRGFIQDIAQVNNILQCTELPILDVMFQENCT